MLETMRGWLQRPAISDPLDRRHAVTMQVLLLFLIVFIPVSWALRWIAGDAPVANMVVSLAMAGWALLCLLLLRRGAFRLSVLLFLGAFQLSLLVGYFFGGFVAQFSSQAPHTIGLFLGALLLGRRTLWLAFLTLLLAIALGVWTDLDAGRDHVWATVPRVLLAFLLVTILLDRFAVVSREMLSREQRRAEELAATHEQLAGEMRGRERLQLALNAAERAQSAELLTAGLAHELNNVLAQTYARLDAAQQVLAPAGDQPLADLRATIDQASGRIARILKLVRRDDVPQQRVQPRVLLEQLEPRLRVVLAEGAQLKLELTDVGELEAVATDLAQIVLALVNNAVAAITPGGLVRIQLLEQECEQRSGCAIVVADNGLGMDAATLAAVGQTLFASPQQGSSAGAGLGLVTCRALTERYGGRLRLRSLPGVGTEAEVWLPYPQTRTSSAVDVEVDRGAVLLVDDDQDVCALLSLVLGKAGFRVDVAESVQAARKAQQSYGNRQPLLVMDRNLPDGDGVSLLEEFASRARGLLAVFSSVQTLREHERDRLGQIKLVELAKPYAPERMVEALRELAAA